LVSESDKLNLLMQMHSDSEKSDNSDARVTRMKHMGEQLVVNQQHHEKVQKKKKKTK
jgi:hypothetical protein